MRIRISTGRFDEDMEWQSFDASSVADFRYWIRRVWWRLDDEGRLRHPETRGRHVEIHLWRRDHWVRVPGRRGGQSLISSPLHAAESWGLVVEMDHHADAIDGLAGWARGNLQARPGEGFDFPCIIKPDP